MAGSPKETLTLAPVSGNRSEVGQGIVSKCCSSGVATVEAVDVAVDGIVESPVFEEQLELSEDNRESLRRICRIIHRYLSWERGSWPGCPSTK